LPSGGGPAAARGANGTPILEIARLREENLVEAARLLATHRGEQLRVEGVSNPDDPDGALYESGAYPARMPSSRAPRSSNGLKVRRWEFV